MSNQPKQVTPIIDLNQFAAITADWFFKKSGEIDQLIAFPEHEAIKVQDNVTGAEYELVGKEREAFIQGLKVARTVFDVLPFEVREVDDEGKPVEATEVQAEA